MLHYDVVVIGSGPAGENGAITAAFAGKKVALVEKEAYPGGASANTGTIPSKALRETALAIQQARSRDAHGIEVRVSGTVTIPELMGRRGLVTSREHSRIRNALNRAGVEQFRGTASFADPHTIKIKIPGGGGLFQELQADTVLLATGTRPFHPPQYGIDNVRVYDSDSILLLDRVPRSLAILGGGVAGCEYASLFAALGVHVALIDSKERLLPWLDAELSLSMQDLFAMAGIELHQQIRAQKLELGDRDVLVTLSDGSRLVAEKVLVAAGRIGNVELLNLPAAGLQATEKGLLEVNPHFQTAVPHVYAAGDLVGFPMLASVSMEQGRVAMSHACGVARRELSGDLPVGIYTIPEVSSIGESEESLRAKGAPVRRRQDDAHRQRAREPHRRGGRVPEAPRRRGRPGSSSGSTASARTPPSSSTSARRSWRTAATSTTSPRRCSTTRRSARRTSTRRSTRSTGCGSGA